MFKKGSVVKQLAQYSVALSLQLGLFAPIVNVNYCEMMGNLFSRVVAHQVLAHIFRRIRAIAYVA